MDIKIDLENPVVRGPLTLFRLFASGPEASSYSSGPEAFEQKLFDVHERGDGAQVPELEIENRSPLALLLIEGEVLVGAKQNRTLNVSVLCKPHGTTMIPVSCVEAGRWGAARRGGRSKFHAGISLRRTKTRSVSEALREGRGKQSDQGAVWKEVDAYATKYRVTSPTSSYDEVLEQVEGSLEELTTGLEPADGQCGVLVGIGGRVRSLDLFDRPSTLRAYWRSLLAGYASDALGERTVPTAGAEALAFVEKLARAPFEESAAPALGSESRVSSEGLTAAALHWGEATVHLAAFAD